MTTKPSISNKNRKIRIRIALIVAGVIVFLGIAAGIILNIVLTPEKITPLVLNLANEYIDAEVECESVEVTFFKTFPQLGISIKNGSVKNQSHTPPDSISTSSGLQTDTLIGFQTCIISFDPIEFLFRKKIIINQLELNHPVIHAFVSPQGKANWDILSQDNTVEDTTSAMQRPELNMKHLHITNATIVYDDREQNIFVAADSLQLKVSGNMSKDSSKLDLQLNMKSLTTYSNDLALTKSLPLGINARLKNNKIKHRLAIEKAQFSIGTLKLDATGTIQRDSINLPAQVDIDFKLQASSLADLLKMIPSHVSDIQKKIVTTGNVSSQGSLKGHLGKDEYPLLTMSFQLNDGSLRSAEHPEKSGIEKIDIDCDALIDMTARTPSSVNINNVILQSASSSLECSGKLTDIFTKPLLTTSIKGNINFDRMSQDFTFAKDVKMGGLIDMDISGRCFLNDVVTLNYGKIFVNGKVNIDNVIFNDPKEDIDFFASSAKLLLGSNVKDSIRGIEKESLFRGDLDIDSLNLKWKTELSANAKNLTARLRTDNLIDTNKIAQMSTMLKFENLRLTMGDSIRIRAVKTNAFLKLAPVQNKPDKPEISARITVDSLRGRMPGLFGRISNAKLAVKIKPQEPRTTRRFASGTDSLLWVARRDSLRKQNQNSTLAFRLESDEAKNALRKWDVDGTLECDKINLRTPYFPLPVRMTQSSIGFTTNTLSLKSTHLKTGSSDMTITGEIEGIRQALLRNGRITAKLDLIADSLDFNEIIRTIVAGSEYSDKDIAVRDSISKLVLDETKDLAKSADTSESGIFIIPRNIDIEFNSTVKNAKYNKLNLKNTSGKIIIRDQSIRLPNFLVSSDVGDARFSLVYKAANTKGAYVGFDMQMRQVYIKELIDAFPMIDTLTPMLKSFEGVVDCNMTAITELDSISDIILPKTTASCYLSGINMVLMDGETFSEISKMLMFKNKKKNIIDSIAVEMIFENSKIMVFPFKATIDRYTVGVGGTQNLDMTFNYHISVLKSPLPFKIGLNVSGTPDNMKFRLAKPKYNDLFTPVKEQSLASTQINLRQQLQESLKKSIDEIINASVSTPIRRSQVILNDSLNQMFFKMDTTVVNYPPKEEVNDSSSLGGVVNKR